MHEPCEARIASLANSYMVALLGSQSSAIGLVSQGFVSIQTVILVQHGPSVALFERADVPGDFNICKT